MKLFTKIKDYFKGAFSEIRKVVWPSKKQTINYSMIVVALSLGMAIFFGVLDYAFNIGLEKIIRRDSTPVVNQTENNGAVLPNFDVNSVNVNDSGSAEAQPVSTYPTKPAK